MDKIETFLHSLLSAPGLSGFEEPVRKQIEDEWRPLTDELTTSPLGSLHGLRRAYASTPRPSVMVAAHMDAIGLMVKEIQGTFLKVSKIGGIARVCCPDSQCWYTAKRKFRELYR